MSKKNISQERIIQAFLASAFEKSAGATSLADISDSLEIKKASLYNHFENRDSMYDATIEYCGKEISAISFLAERTIEAIISDKSNPQTLFKRLISRYFNLFENEPLFTMYVFIHTEQYFNAAALAVVTKEIDKIEDEIKQVLTALQSTGKIVNKTEKEIKEISATITAIILQQRDIYIAKKKETVRQNPECGVGSLFALPTDETAVNRAVKLVDLIVKGLFV